VEKMSDLIKQKESFKQEVDLVMDKLLNWEGKGGDNIGLYFYLLLHTQIIHIRFL
jgi:hypothetical protein